MSIISLVEQRLKLVRQIQDETVNKTDVSGNLIIKNEHGTKRYYKDRSSQGLNMEYLGKNKTDEIKRLEEKNYYSKLLRILKKEEMIMLEILHLLEEKPDYESVFFDIPENKRHLITPYQEKLERIKDEKLLEWHNRVLRKKSTGFEKAYITNNGETVRSKSEVIIADRLLFAGVPYYYESPLLIGNIQTWHPDFKILNKRTGEVYWWEHFGLMDDPEYCASCESKLEIFADNGIFYGKNLIITMESSLHSLNTVFVDSLIKEYLL